MGYERNSNKRLTFREENDAISILTLETENRDIAKSFSIESLFRSILNQKLNNLLPDIDVRKITTLELSHCDITEVPLACANLNLHHLGLSHNKLSSVPVCLYSGLKHLRSLDLGHNLLSNFDMEPECLPFVKDIRLNNNKFENIPKWFLMFRCTNLESFDYSKNKAKHYKHLKNSFNLNLIKLRKLELRNNYLIDEDYAFLKCFKSLKYLDISNEDSEGINNFNDLDNLFVKPKWKELNILKLNHLSISIFPEGIPWIETLKELHITNNCISWIPEGIEFLVNLEILDVSHNDIISLPSKITALEGLMILKASDNFIEIAPDFSRLPNLKTLDLYNNYLEQVNFNINTVDLVDLDENYFDPVGLENFTDYLEKRNRLRKYMPSVERYEGPKEFIERMESPPCDYSFDGDDYYRYSFDEDYSKEAETRLNNFDETENWDLPSNLRPKNPEIDSIDDEWQGEERRPSSVISVSTEKVYINDEDWMFEDIEET